MAVHSNLIQDKFIKRLVKDYQLAGKNRQTFPVDHYPPPFTGGKPDLETFLQKPVRFFCPHRNVTGFSLQHLHCTKCGSDGMKEKCLTSNPCGRAVHDLKFTRYLVQCRYQCLNCSETYLASDLFEQYPMYIQSMLGVQLYEKTAITLDVLNYITCDATTGKSFSEVGGLIGAFRVTEYLKRKSEFLSAADFFYEFEQNRLAGQLNLGLVPAEGTDDAPPPPLPYVVPVFPAMDDPNGYNEVVTMLDETIVNVFIAYVNTLKPLLQTMMASSVVSCLFKTHLLMMVV
jgi:hypothetical protein